VISGRLDAARAEISHVRDFDYVIINDQFGVAVQDLVAIVRAQRLRRDVQTARHGGLINRMT
jgi:guanylate kinase